MNFSWEDPEKTPYDQTEANSLADLLVKLGSSHLTPFALIVPVRPITGFVKLNWSVPILNEENIKLISYLILRLTCPQVELQKMSSEREICLQHSKPNLS